MTRIFGILLHCLALKENNILCNLNFGEERKNERKTKNCIFTAAISRVFVLLGGLLWTEFGKIVAIFTFGACFLLNAFLVFGIKIIVGSKTINNNPKSTHMRSHHSCPKFNLADRSRNGLR